jgi:hypothetical protein
MRKILSFQKFINEAYDIEEYDRILDLYNLGGKANMSPEQIAYLENPENSPVPKSFSPVWVDKALEDAARAGSRELEAGPEIEPETRDLDGDIYVVKDRRRLSEEEKVSQIDPQGWAEDIDDVFLYKLQFISDSLSIMMDKPQNTPEVLLINQDTEISLFIPELIKAPFKFVQRIGGKIAAEGSFTMDSMDKRTLRTIFYFQEGNRIDSIYTPKITIMDIYKKNEIYISGYFKGAQRTGEWIMYGKSQKVIDKKTY